MQERYLGDIHDFFKFNFLEFVANSFNKKIGLNWYLVEPELIGKSELKKNDGEKRMYLFDPKYKEINHKLLQELQKFKSFKQRNIESFSIKLNPFKLMKFYNKPLPLEKRSKWVMDSIEFFKNTDVIFLDPDNGVSFKNYGKKALKYIQLDDLKTYYLNNKIVIFTQFQSYNLSHKKYLQKIITKLKENDLHSDYPILRNRTSPNTFYITISRFNDNKFSKILKNYSENFQKVDIVTF